ncbi:MAG: hypothetical protein LBR79_00150 [Oscillospiraceae bacterium]|nr:hypothetical protein [Oscillospiraceae bacterium]
MKSLLPPRLWRGSYIQNHLKTWYLPFFSQQNAEGKQKCYGFKRLLLYSVFQKTAIFTCSLSAGSLGESARANLLF